MSTLQDASVVLSHTVADIIVAAKVICFAFKKKSGIKSNVSFCQLKAISD